jgi:hypothetical protein
MTRSPDGKTWLKKRLRKASFGRMSCQNIWKMQKKSLCTAHFMITIKPLVMLAISYLSSKQLEIEART